MIETITEVDAEDTPATKGPPGGGRMVRDSVAAPSVKGPPVRRTIQPSTPAEEESVGEGMAEIHPTTDRRMLMPAEAATTAALRPVKVMKPQESEEKTAPIKQVRVLRPQVTEASSEEE